jgi:hypothetical protein
MVEAGRGSDCDKSGLGIVQKELRHMVITLTLKI